MKLFLLLPLLLAATLCLHAQEGYPGLDVVLAPSGPPTVHGCLGSSGGEYFVTAADGTVTNLAGDTARLSRYVGHEVEINGKPTVITLDTTVTHAASTVEELPALDVKTVTDVSKTCASK